MYKSFEVKYKELIKDILTNGTDVEGRNGGTRFIFGQQLVIDDLEQGLFPLITSRKMYINGIAGEMAAFLKGPGSLRDFEIEGCNYWKEWADEDGQLEVDYGNAWLDFNGVNQLEEVVHAIRTNPHSRRHIITAWNPARLDKLSLPCCHWAYSWAVNGPHLEMIWIQRSVDTMIGLPSDIALAAIFNILMANATGYKPGKLVLQLGNCHLYHDHFENIGEYLDNPMHDLPTYKLLDDFNTYRNDSLEIINYKHENPIKYKVVK